MIKSFAHKGLEQFFLTGNKAGIQPLHANRIRLILAQLQQARTIDDLRIPTLRLHECQMPPDSVPPMYGQSVPVVCGQCVPAMFSQCVPG